MVVTCLCRKYGLSITACKNCNGISCENAGVSVDHVLDADDDDLIGDDVDEEQLFNSDDGGIIDEDEIDYYLP